MVDPGHGLLESRTGNFNITQKNEKTDALIFAVIDEFVYFFFKWKVHYSAIDPYQIWNLNLKIRAHNRASPKRGAEIPQKAFYVCTPGISLLPRLFDSKQPCMVSVGAQEQK